MFFSRTRAWVWRVTRPLRWLTKWLLILTIPIWLEPTLSGFVLGITNTIWLHGRPRMASASLESEISMHNFQAYMSVPGAQTMEEFQAAKDPFQVPKITSLNWMDRLRVMQPLEHADPDPRRDRSASLDGLARVKSYAGPKLMWVYVTSLAMPDYVRWDGAFRSLVEWRDAQEGEVPTTSLQYLDCAESSFLCETWHIKQRHSILMFEQLDEWPEADLDEFGFPMPEPRSYQYPRMQLRPVRVKAIDLPFTFTRDKVFPETGFATELDQLKALVSNPIIAEDWYDYNLMMEMIDRFEEHAGRLERRSPTFKLFRRASDRAGKFVHNINDEWGMAHDAIEFLTFSLTWLIGVQAWEAAEQAVNWFLSKPDWRSQAQYHVEEKPTNFMDDMFAGFMDQVLAGAFQSMTADEAGTTPAPSMTESLRLAMSSGYSKAMADARSGAAAEPV